MEEYKEKIRQLNKQIFNLKRKLDEKDENMSIATFFQANNETCYKIYSSLSLNEIFKKVCNSYENGLHNICFLQKINGGESLKKFFTFVVDDVKYLLIDFTLAVENADHFVNLANYYSDSKYCIPKVYYCNNNIVVTEYVEGNTLENLTNSTVRHKLINDITLKCVDWIIEFKKTKCDFINFSDSFNFYKDLSLNKLVSLIKKSEINCTSSPNVAKAIRLVDDIYSNSDICMCHNDFMPANVICDKNKNIKIIDYHDLGYNTEHYDIVSLLYSPKKYFSDKERGMILNYYYDNLDLKSDYPSFISDIIKIAFVRICRSLDLRFNKIETCKKCYQEIPLLLLVETRRALDYLSSLESYVDIHIADNLKQLLPNSDIISVTLCAGKGTRMLSDLPKCATQILNVPMIEYITNTLNAFACKKNIYVVGYKKEIIQDIVKSCSNNYVFVEQREQLGTGHAVMQCISELEDNKTIIVVMGDMPTINCDILSEAIFYHKRKNAVSTVVGTKLKQINSNGKIIRDKIGNFVKIVEHKDIDSLYSSEEAKTVKNGLEVNTGLYIFNSTYLKKYLTKIDNKNVQNEYYLTDIIKLQKEDNLNVECVSICSMSEMTGANTTEEVKQIEGIFSE